MILIKGLGVAIATFSATANPANIPEINSPNSVPVFRTPILLVEAEETADFPIPEDAVNYSKQATPGVGRSVNFQTDFSLTEAIEFYRNQ